MWSCLWVLSSSKYGPLPWRFSVWYLLCLACSTLTFPLHLPAYAEPTGSESTCNQVWVTESGINSRGFSLKTREEGPLLLMVSLQSCPMTKAGYCNTAGSCGRVEGGAAAALRTRVRCPCLVSHSSFVSFSSLYIEPWDLIFSGCCWLSSYERFYLFPLPHWWLSPDWHVWVYEDLPDFRNALMCGLCLVCSLNIHWVTSPRLENSILSDPHEQKEPNAQHSSPLHLAGTVPRWASCPGGPG